MRIEIGPGSGRYKFKPFLKGDDVYYVDINEPPFPIKNWVKANACDLPFPNESADEVVALHVIEHLEDPSCLVREARRVLKKGGILVIATPNFISRNAYADPDHKAVFNYLTLRTLLKKYGFKIVYHPYGNVGSLLPRPLRKLLGYFFALICDELFVAGIKM